MAGIIAPTTGNNAGTGKDGRTREKTRMYLNLAYTNEAGELLPIKAITGLTQTQIDKDSLLMGLEAYFTENPNGELTVVMTGNIQDNKPVVAMKIK